MVATTRADAVAARDIPTVVEEVREATFTAKLQPEVRALVEDFAAVEMRRVGAALAFNVVDAKVVGFLSEFAATRARSIARTTRAQIARQLAAGIEAGEGIALLSRRIQSVFTTATTSRARLIARTEVNQAANFARQAAFEQSKLVPRRRWLATLDTRVRDSHLMLNGQSQPIDTPFRIPGTSKTAMYPGGFNDPAQDANCRCTIIPDIPRVDRVDDEEDERDFEARLSRWEARINEVVQEVFNETQTRVLRTLRRVDRR